MSPGHERVNESGCDVCVRQGDRGAILRGVISPWRVFNMRAIAVGLRVTTTKARLLKESTKDASSW
jgi:hypothetical protein